MNIIKYQVNLNKTKKIVLFDIAERIGSKLKRITDAQWCTCTYEEKVHLAISAWKNEHLNSGFFFLETLFYLQHFKYILSRRDRSLGYTHN